MKVSSIIEACSESLKFEFTFVYLKELRNSKVENMQNILRAKT